MSNFDEEALAIAVSQIEDEKISKIISSLLGITTLSEKEVLERLDSIWEHGFHEGDTNSFTINDSRAAYIEGLEFAIHTIESELTVN